MTEPSKGAMRAARIIEPWDAWKADRESDPVTQAFGQSRLEATATIIDRETKAGLMLEALKAVGPYLTDCRHDVSEGPQEERQCPKCDALRKRAVAIHAAENGDS